MMILTTTTTAMPNLKGGYIPRDKPRVNSYKLTAEGYALLYLVERVKGGQEQPQKQQEQPQRITRR